MWSMKVGEALREHLQTVERQTCKPTPAQGVEFQDDGDDASDSGLESII